MAAPARARRTGRARGDARRNARVRRVYANAWQTERLDKFAHALRWAAAAKSTRTALDVTQAEAARALRVGVKTVQHRESGSYFGWDAGRLDEWNRTMHRLARRLRLVE